MICSTLSGKVSVKHPTLGVLVREDGAVFNKKYSNKYNHEYHWTFGHIKKKTGYRQITINSKSYAVHRLVAEAFLPNPDNKPYVDHINRNRSDNRVVNLRWVDAKENAENSSNVFDKCKYGVRRCNELAKWDSLRKKAYREANPEKVKAENRERMRKWRANNPERAREINRRSDQKRRAAKKQQKAAQ